MSQKVTVVEWNWRDSGKNMVVFEGLNEDGERVAERVFKRTTTNVINSHGDSVPVEDHGGWPKEQTFEVQNECDE